MEFKFGSSLLLALVFILSTSVFGSVFFDFFADNFDAIP